MRWKIPAGIVLALALLIPAAPAAAHDASSGLDATTCQAVVYADVRELVTIDLDTASDTEVPYLNHGLYFARALDCTS